MPLGLATATTATEVSNGRLWLVGIMLALAWCGWYVIACAVFPFSNCAGCEGSGKKRDGGGKGKNWRNCRRCKGTGKRIRLGRYIYNYLRKLEKDAT